MTEEELEELRWEAEEEERRQWAELAEHIWERDFPEEEEDDG